MTIRVNGVEVGGGGGGASLPTTAPDDLLDGATPDSVFITSVAGNGELVTFPAFLALVLTWTPSLASLSGWTDVSSGGGSVAISGGTLTGTVPGSIAATIVGAATIPWGSTDCFDVRARVQITGDTTANAKAHLRVVYAGGDVTLMLRGDGALQLFTTVGGYALWASASGRPVDGTCWVRLRVVGTQVSAWYATGATAPDETDWTLFHGEARAALVGQAGPTTLHLGGQTEGAALTTGTDFLWRSVSARSLSGAS